jgi:hypothetical protein
MREGDILTQLYDQADNDDKILVENIFSPPPTMDMFGLGQMSYLKYSTNGTLIS